MGLGKTIVVLDRILQDINEENEKMGGNGGVEDVEEDDEDGAGTLIIVVTSLLTQWESEIDAKIHKHQLGRNRRKYFSRYTYYGSDRGSSSKLTNADVVLTTFGVIAAEHKAGNGTLFNLHWRRVVLDEAQSIRNDETLMSKAVCQIKGDRRWCLTGTPLLNGINDLFQLFRFIKLEPWGLRIWWNRVIERPYKTGNPAALQRIRSVLGDGPVLLRRTHKMVETTSGSNLPPLTVTILHIDLTEPEKHFYESLYNQSKLEFDGMVASGKATASYITILALLMRLRQAADHPFLVLGRPKGDKVEESQRDDEYIRKLSAKFFSETDKKSFAQKMLKNLAKGSEECPVCLSEMQDPVLTPCCHSFCKGCASKCASSDNYYGGGQCPVCREKYDQASLVSIHLPSKENQISLKDGSIIEDAAQLLGERYRSSSKLDRMIKEIEIRRKDQNKFIIFSQFTQMLDLCQVALSKMSPSVTFQRLDGSMSSSKREHSLKTFKEDVNCEVLLMSLKAGCLGLNITCANFVFLMDPWWNAAVEQQAIGRAHRMGQTRPVTVLRFIANDTVEIKMLGVQEKKKMVAADALGFEQFGDESRATSKLTLDDLKEFFS